MPFLQLILGFALQSAARGIEGYVTDDSTGLPIHGARIDVADASAWTMTDTLGYYALRTDQGGTQRLRVMRLGYETQALDVVLPSFDDLRVDIAMRAQPTLMPLVRVSALRLFSRAALKSSLSEVTPLGVRRWSSAQLAAHPALADVDALGAFGADADVSVAPESPTTFHVRGGSSDQTHVLIDGVPFYNAAHSAG
ncbi:MAG: carboxypeptidase regulatory-like domain-containing protein, partial [Gemmatimonadaceae bacterium]